MPPMTQVSGFLVQLRQSLSSQHSFKHMQLEDCSSSEGGIDRGTVRAFWQFDWRKCINKCTKIPRRSARIEKSAAKKPGLVYTTKQRRKRKKKLILPEVGSPWMASSPMSTHTIVNDSWKTKDRHGKWL